MLEIFKLIYRHNGIHGAIDEKAMGGFARRRRRHRCDSEFRSATTCASSTSIEEAEGNREAGGQASRRDWYLSVEDRRDVIEQPIDDDLDVSGRALRLLRKSNPPLLEWLKSPVVYRDDPVFAAEFGALATEFYCRSGGHAECAPRPVGIGAFAPRVRRGAASRTTCTWPSATGATTCAVARK